MVPISDLLTLPIESNMSKNDCSLFSASAGTTHSEKPFNGGSDDVQYVIITSRQTGWWWEIISAFSFWKPTDTSDHFTQCNIRIECFTFTSQAHTHTLAQRQPPLLEFWLVEFLWDVGLRTGMGSRRQEMSDHRPYFPPNPASQKSLGIHRGNEAERHLSPPGFWCGELFGYCGHLFIL